MVLLKEIDYTRTIIKNFISFALFFFYLARQTLGRDSLKHEEPLHSRAMSLLLVSWVKVDVSHAGLASICHRPEKSVAISRRYAGDPRRTVIIHGKWNYKSHPTSGNVPFTSVLGYAAQNVSSWMTPRRLAVSKASRMTSAILDPSFRIYLIRFQQY